MAQNTWRLFTILRCGAVPVPQWTIVLRILEALFALIVIGLLGYTLHYHGGGLVRCTLYPPSMKKKYPF